MGSKKVQTYIVVPSDTGPRTSRLIKGALKGVESRLRSEWDVRVATAEEAHSMADVEIEDATGEP